MLFFVLYLVTIFLFVVANYVVPIAFIFVLQGTTEKQHLVTELFFPV